MSQPVEVCPRCGFPVRKVVSRFSHRKNIFAPSYLKEHGFKKLKRNDEGGYTE